MSLRVFKYAFNVEDRFSVEMPEDATILHVDVQGEQGPCMWALVDEVKPVVSRRFAVFGTGHRIPLEGALLYVRTFQQPPRTFQQPPFVWHLFEVNP